MGGWVGGRGDMAVVRARRQWLTPTPSCLAAARLQQLLQSMREWAQRASQAASDEWLQAVAEAGETARPRRAVTPSGGLATRALGDALVGSTRGRKADRAASPMGDSTVDANCALPASSETTSMVPPPPTWQSQLPPKTAEQIWFATSAPTAAEPLSHARPGRGVLGGAGRGAARVAQGEAGRSSPPQETSSDSFEVEVSLYKLKHDSRLGMTLTGSGFPWVEKLVEGGAAYGRLAEGDVLLSVNGQEACGHEATTTLLKSLQGAMLLNVRREAPSKHG